MKIISILYLYRIAGWKGRTAWTRGLAYIFLGYAAAGKWEFAPLAINLIVIFGIMMPAYALNDYYDYKLLKEKNYIGAKLKSGKMSETQAKIIAFLPLLLVFLLFFLESSASRVLLLIFLVITFLYNLPPLRLKKRWGWLYSPICAGLGFLEAFFILGQWNLSIFGLLVLVILFHFYTEMVHFLEEFQKGAGGSPASARRALKLFKLIPYLSLLSGLALTRVNGAFIIAVLFSAARIIAGRKVNLDYNFYKLHRNLLSPVYSVYEYAIYIILGILGSFTA